MKRLYVCYQESLVGELVINAQQQYYFQYYPTWLSDSNAFSLSCSLLLHVEPFEHRVSYAFFANLIPEGDLRYKIAKLLGISDKNDFALLEAIGGEVAGAISLNTAITPPSISSDIVQKNLSLHELATILQKIDHDPFLVNEGMMRLSLAGAQNKLPLIYDQQQFSLYLFIGKFNAFNGL